jgi:hypothetical protein
MRMFGNMLITIFGPNAFSNQKFDEHVKVDGFYVTTLIMNVHERYMTLEAW